MAQDRPGEFELIKSYFAPLASDPGSLGLTDDAAVLRPEPGFDLVLTKDVLAADVHFFADDAPEAIAAKALRVNLSDLAAKGAKPRGYLLGLALPSDWTELWLERFCAGLSADQSAYDVRLLGGDTIRSNNGLQVSITAIGQVEEGKAVRRSGARPGDILFVTGTIGDAAAGLAARLDPVFCERASLAVGDENHILDRYLLPRPRTKLAPLLVGHASAAMDVSDGLFADCGHLANASGTGLEIDLAKVPVSPAMKHLQNKAFEYYVRFLNGGDDYEILAAVPAEKAERFRRGAELAGCPVTEIGIVSEEAGRVKVTKDGHPLALAADGGFRHF
ncbi:thiamine-phosphate kinase [Roseibium sp. HPY-6]|uniref:thiamine-phosphate kinase n=1 Tax=Roseibium sp. HPY-6 TaxID=3229852 RepID=UPI0033906A89